VKLVASSFRVIGVIRGKTSPQSVTKLGDSTAKDGPKAQRLILPFAVFRSPLATALKAQPAGGATEHTDYTEAEIESATMVRRSLPRATND